MPDTLGIEDSCEGGGAHTMRSNKLTRECTWALLACEEVSASELHDAAAADEIEKPADPSPVQGASASHTCASASHNQSQSSIVRES